MVEAQLRGRDVVDERVLAAMERVPRELFVPEKLRHRAYDDAALPIGADQTISQPYMVARICAELQLHGGEKVLDVGTGSGYQAAVLAELAGYVVPSRLYGILAVSRPVIVAADAESETAQLVSEAGCGIVVPPGRPELLARALRDAHDGKYDLEAMGARGREWVEREADRSVAVRRYRDLLLGLAS